MRDVLIQHGANWLMVSRAQYALLQLASHGDGTTCKATAARTARKLLALGLIERVDTPGEVSRWVATEAGRRGIRGARL